MLVFKPEEKKENIIDPRPGELKCHISAWVFFDSKLFNDVGEWSRIDSMVTIQAILEASKGIKRAIVSGHTFYLPK